MRCPFDQGVADWAAAASAAMQQIDTTARRHGRTWFVGVDALANDASGAVGGVALPFAGMCATWHRAQVSIIYPDYPQQDAGESDAAHRFRRNRDAAHMDGLLPEGPDKRRHLREPHGFILGIALDQATASPLVVWEGSHVIMQRAFAAAFEGVDPRSYGEVDVTDVYQAARRAVFDSCARVTVHSGLGEAVLLHRHLIHGVAPWADDTADRSRAIAYFRPLIEPARWL